MRRYLGHVPVSFTRPAVFRRFGLRIRLSQRLGRRPSLFERFMAWLNRLCRSFDLRAVAVALRELKEQQNRGPSI
jgi:hypothetical protein